MDAMKKEIKSNDVWDLVELPKDRKTDGSKTKEIGLRSEKAC